MSKTEKILSNHSIGPTQMRSKIYPYLRRKQSAVSFSDLKKVFAEKSETNKTANRTIFYRNHKIFEDKGLIHQINDGIAMAKFAISGENTKSKYGTDLHLHFHCTECKKTICLPNKIPEESLPSDYKINDVNLVLKGICLKCKEK